MDHTAELMALLEAGQVERTRPFVQGLHPADLAEAMHDLSIEDIWRIISFLSPERQALVFGYLPLEIAAELSHVLSRKELAIIFTEMSADDRTDLFNKLTPEEQQTLIPALSQAEREDIRRLASYPEGTTGAIMTSDYALLSPELTAHEALNKLRLEAPDKETIYQSYVIDEARRLIGTVRLKDLIIAPPDMLIKNIMRPSSSSLLVSETQEDAVRKIAKYDTLALPVIDEDGRLVGIVTHDDAMDAAEAEVTEDFHKMAHVGKLTTSFRDATIQTLYKHRIAWLLLLIFVNIFSGTGIAYFEDVISHYVVLVFFLPLLIGSAGNAGSQSATLMIRAMATGDVQMKDWRELMGREFVVSLAIGLTMAAAVASIGYFWGGPNIALVVAISMCAVVMIGSIIGMSLPFLLRHFNLDPATASAPLVTSIADITGVIIYFTIATMLLESPPLAG
ncbi:MAG: magnesium transporter [Alphaproteobacteria bacterium]|nr:magnesium transporter [Alphaproteobacteria bacterium]